MGSKRETIKEKYGFPYETAKPNSGLIRWYNELLNKTICDLNTSDVSKMIRQGILKEKATNTAICLFLKNPYDGEMWDGDLLETIISVGADAIKKSGKIDELKKRIPEIESTYDSFEWQSSVAKKKYMNNLDSLKEIISYSNL